jgi:hypothetical protein
VRPMPLRRRRSDGEVQNGPPSWGPLIQMTLRQACLFLKRGAMCVQRFDDSQCSAIHTTFRASLRSSSMQEPRDPLLKVLFCFRTFRHKTVYALSATPEPGAEAHFGFHRFEGSRALRPFVNDPSAGSPTETLLRLLLPLNDQV